MTTDYQRIIMINLVKNKGPEAKLTTELKNLMLASNIKTVKHVPYDFHGET